MDNIQKIKMEDFLKISRIKFLGTGGIFDYELGNSSAIVQIDKGNILIDCGYTTFIDLSKKGLLDSIDYLLITHLHGDHVGGLHPAILYWANKRGVKIKVLYPTEKFKIELKDYMQVFLLNVDNYVDFIPVSDFKEIGFLDTSGQHIKGMQSFAYYFNFENQFLYYSGDLGNLNATIDLIKKVKHANIIIFHEVFFAQGNVHVYYKELEILADDYIVFAYHCNPANAPVDCSLHLVQNFQNLKL